MGGLRNVTRFLVLIAVSLGLAAPALGHQAGQGSGKTAAQPSDDKPVKVKLLDLELVDQDGSPLRFASEAVGERIVVIDFVFTSCTTVCPLLSQVMAQVQDGLSEALKRDVRLLSLSVDPATDTPRRLKRHAGRLGVGPGWLWLTGHKPEMNRVLDGLGVYTPEFAEHPGTVLVGDGRSGTWTRFYGIPSPEQIIAKVEQLAAGRRPTDAAPARDTEAEETDLEREDKARRYFTDLPVVTHDGRELRFFTDLLKEKIVVVNLFYTACADACPFINSKLAVLQDELDGHLGRDVFIVSVTLDPETDTREVLEAYAANFGPRGGWSFVTGEPENILAIARRLGHVTEEIAAHGTHLMVGDVEKAYWKKFPPQVSPELLGAFLTQLASAE